MVDHQDVDFVPASVEQLFQQPCARLGRLAADCRAGYSAANSRRVLREIVVAKENQLMSIDDGNIVLRPGDGKIVLVPGHKVTLKRRFANSGSKQEGRGLDVPACPFSVSREQKLR